MSFIHASAVTDGKQTILLSSASGSGKSTMAGLLLKNGFQLVSDDFIPLDAKSKHAYPFPAAVSLKEGAYALFSSAHLKELNYHGLINKSFQYLNPEITGKSWYRAYPVKKIVFIRYNPEVIMKFTKLPILKALSMFHDEARVATSYENAKRFINWFVGVKCYSMEYSNSDLAIQKITEMFKKN